MKTLLSAQRVGFLALALATASVTATFAQTTSTTTPAAPTCTAGGGHHHGSVLTAAEKAQLKTARDEAFATDPSLKADEDTLKQQFESLKSAGDSATVDQKNALHAQARDFHQKLQAAELKLDPTLAPVFAKLQAAHKHGHHHDSSSAT